MVRRVVLGHAVRLSSCSNPACGVAVILTDHARVLPGVGHGAFASPVVIRREP